jgi:hypothetical protein
MAHVTSNFLVANRSERKSAELGMVCMVGRDVESLRCLSRRSVIALESGPRVWCVRGKNVTRLTCMGCDMLSVRKRRKGGPRYCRRDGYKSTPRPSASVAAIRIRCQLHRLGVSQLRYCGAGLYCLPCNAQLVVGQSLSMLAQLAQYEVRRWIRQTSKHEAVTREG